MENKPFQPKDENQVLPPPDHVMIQTISGCNGSCVFCPNRKTRRKIPFGRSMDEDLYRKIVDQCLALGVRRYSIYLMNEPMLDKKLALHIAYVTARIQKPQYVKIISHGGLLTESMAKGLLESGLKKLKISIQSLEPETYKQIMGLSLTMTLKNIDRFLALKQAGGYKLPRLEISVVDTLQTHAEIPAMRKYWQKRGLKLYVEPVENRAQQESIHQTALGVKGLKAFSWCKRMNEQLAVLYDGKVVQCCADWEQASVMGDLSTQSLMDVWYGERYMTLRRRFAAGDVKGTLCAGCRKLAG
jgi:molybdenum cofactor biosynthesis enzyme MoaA